MKNKNKAKIIIFCIILLLIILCVGTYIFLNKKTIVFKEKYLTMEYGTKFDYVNSIEKLNPTDIEIIYPDIEVKEVGTYNLIFQCIVNGKKHEQNQTFVVKDTKIPNVILKNKKTVEVIQNSNYDFSANISEIKNFDEDAKKNKQKLSESEYKKMKKKITETRNEIANRVISSKDDIKVYDISNNCLIYTTNLDLSNIGNYEVKVLAVDSNYNYDEVEWKIKVVKPGQIVNSGGSVVCSYPNDNIQFNDAYVTDYTETYYYDENKIVSSIDFVTIMTFKDSYDTNENITLLMESINSSYKDYSNYKGVIVTVTNEGNKVITKINVDMNQYDHQKNELKILEKGKQGNIKIVNVVEKMKNQASCELY